MFINKYFTKIIVYYFVEDLRGETIVSPSKKLNDLIHLAELCVDLLQQNEEHYAEVSIEYSAEIFVITLSSNISIIFEKYLLHFNDYYILRITS